MLEIVDNIVTFLLLLTSVSLIILVLMHKGTGAGLSDMFGGGVSSTGASSPVAQRNLDRITYFTACVWVASIIAAGFLSVA